MIDWPTLQSGVITLWQSLTGITDVRWQDTQAGFVAADAFVKAEIQAFGLSSVGALDALTWAEKSADGPLLQTMHGQRELTLRTKVTVLDQRVSMVARGYIEKLRDRMAWDSTRDALYAVSLGFQNAGSPIDLSAQKKIDQHVMSVAALDIRFNVGVSDTDPTEYERVETAEPEFTMTPA